MENKEEKFYLNVAKIIGCADHNYRPYPFRKRTRWNTRTIGNGRFPGHGIIRRFSDNNIHVQLYNPNIKGVFRSDEDALNAIRMSLKN